MQVKNTVVVITGGASGLGAATAEYLIKQGAKVAILDANPQGVAAIAIKLNCLAVTCDVTNAASVTAAFDQIKQKYGVARVCVNFAGILDGGRIVAREGPMDLEHFSKVIEVDLIGTFNVMRLALAAMIGLEPIGEAEERGVVINISSIAAVDGQIGQVAYSAAKAGGGRNDLTSGA